MDNTKNTSIFEEEPIFFNPPTISTFGVYSKKIKSPKNIYMSFTPLSSNRSISFTNTIMYPIITPEANIEIKKNKIHSDLAKNKQLDQKDSTGIKTESSKEDKNNLSYDKKISEILGESNENEDLDETKTICKDNKQSKDNLEINPFFTGGKSSLDINKYLKQNDNNDNSIIEEKKIIKFLNKSKNKTPKENLYLYYKTTKNVIEDINNTNHTPFNNKSLRRSLRVKTLNLAKSQKVKKSEKDQQQNLRKNKNKHKTFLTMENMLLKNYKAKPNKRYSDSKIDIKNPFVRSRGKGRELTAINKSPRIKLNENNIKLYRERLFNIKSNKKIRSKMRTYIIKENSEEIEEEDKIQKKFGMSDNSLYTNLCIETPKHGKNEEKFEGRKRLSRNINNDLRLKSKEFSENLTLKKRKLSQNLIQFKRLKSFNKINDPPENKKSQINVKKKTYETSKNLDFESALKNKKNLANTQFNLFSPDKFTNTQFCGSDYCEYTLDCMDLILNNNKSQKQVKSKVNFNFPKSTKNKLKKKIALFDLDETLVHCTGDINLNKEQYQHSIDINLPGNKEVTVGINIRPFWKKTLNLIKKHYYIVVFTASHQAYADAVLDFMDPNKKYFKYRLYRNNCSLVDVEGAKFYVKDLDIFDEYYDLKDIVIIDNSVLSFIYHLENGIPIVPYYNEDKDGSLYVVGLYLMHIYKEDDLREANKKYINLDSFLKEAKERNDFNSTINEESISAENNNGINSNEPNDNMNINKDTNKSELKRIKSIKSNDSDNKQFLTNRRKSLCYSLQSEKDHQNKLISQSKLMHTYYSINDKCVSNCDTKSKNNITSDEENDMNDKNKNNKDDISSFFKHRLLTNRNESRKSKITFKHSNKTCKDYLDLKLVCSNFNHNFFPEKNI